MLLTITYYLCVPFALNVIGYVYLLRLIQNKYSYPEERRTRTSHLVGVLNQIMAPYFIMGLIGAFATQFVEISLVRDEFAVVGGLLAILFLNSLRRSAELYRQVKLIKSITPVV